MKTITINRNSWHYRIARFGDYSPAEHGADICAYMRRILVAVIAASFIAAIGLLAGGAAAFVLGDFIAWLAYIVLNGWIEPSPVAVAILVVLSVVTVATAVWLTARGTKAAVQSSEILSAGWDSVHNRICARIQIVRDE